MRTINLSTSPKPKPWRMGVFQRILMTFAVMLSTAAVQAADTRAPDELIREISQNVMKTIRENPEVRGGDVDRINALIDERLAPFSDFERTTQITVGPKWREASTDDRKQLVAEFRNLLVLVYSGALRNFRDQVIQFRPFRAAPTDTDVVVRTAVVHQGNPVQVDYRLYKTPDGWKIYDVNVLGLWLTEAYRNQFRTHLNEGGVPQLLKVLQNHNRTLRENRAKGRSS